MYFSTVQSFTVDFCAPLIEFVWRSFSWQSQAKDFNYFCSSHCFCLHWKGPFLPFLEKVDISKVLSQSHCKEVSGLFHFIFLGCGYTQPSCFWLKVSCQWKLFQRCREWAITSEVPIPCGDQKLWDPHSILLFLHNVWVQFLILRASRGFLS